MSKTWLSSSALYALRSIPRCSIGNPFSSKCSCLFNTREKPPKLPWFARAFVPSQTWCRSAATANVWKIQASSLYHLILFLIAFMQPQYVFSHSSPTRDKSRRWAGGSCPARCLCPTVLASDGNRWANERCWMTFLKSTSQPTNLASQATTKSKNWITCNVLVTQFLSCLTPVRQGTPCTRTYSSVTGKPHFTVFRFLLADPPPPAHNCRHQSCL